MNIDMDSKSLALVTKPLLNMRWSDSRQLDGCGCGFCGGGGLSFSFSLLYKILSVFLSVLSYLPSSCLFPWVSIKIVINIKCFYVFIEIKQRKQQKQSFLLFSFILYFSTTKQDTSDYSCYRINGKFYAA